MAHRVANDHALLCSTPNGVSERFGPRRPPLQEEIVSAQLLTESVSGSAGQASTLVYLMPSAQLLTESVSGSGRIQRPLSGARGVLNS